MAPYRTALVLAAGLLGAVPAAGQQRPAKISPEALAIMNAAASRLQRATSVVARIQEGYWDSTGLRPSGDRTLRAHRKGFLIVDETMRLTAADKSKYEAHSLTIIRDTGLAWHAQVGVRSNDSGKEGPPRTTVRTGQPRDEAWRQLRRNIAPFGPFVIPAGDYEVGELLWLPTRIDDPTLRVLDDEGTIEIDGKPLRVIKWVKLAYQGLTAPEDAGNSMAEVVDTVRYYFSLGSDTVARRVTIQTSRGRNPRQIDVSGVEIDGPLTVADLEWTPPAGVTVTSNNYQPKVEEGDSIYAVGQQFVNFVLPAVDSTGALSVMTLDSALAKYDMLLLWLWASH